MLLNLVGSIVGRVLVALGMAVITYTGINASLEALKTQAIQSFTSLPPEVFVMKVGVAISIVTSAIAARLLLDGLTSDTFKRFVLK